QPRRAEKTNPGYLDWRRLEGKHLQPAVCRVAGEVDQDVDAVAANLGGDLVVADIDRGTPMVGKGPKPRRRFIRILDLGIAMDLDLPTVVRGEQRLDEMS